jgi:hypothetical protein
MDSSAADTLGVLFRAMILARDAGASEINIDHLLAALDQPSSHPPRSEPPPPPLPVERLDLPFSPEAVSVMSTFGDVSCVPVDVLRRALLAGRREGVE